MQTVGCCLDFKSASEILEHLANCNYHFGYGIGNAQLRANSKGEYYLRDFINPNNSRFIDKNEALNLIELSLK